MSKIRYRDTRPEIAFRKALHSAGLKYRVNYGKERIDIAFPNLKLAIFIDGCFWHGCPLHSHIPKSNKRYWVPKLKKNLQRAKAKDLRLKKDGWKILHVWEHQLTADKISSTLKHTLTFMTTSYP